MAEYLAKLRYHIFLCDDAGDFCGCEAAGAGAVRKQLRMRLALRRLAPYVKTTLMTCNQAGARGPVAVVYPDGVWYDGLTVDDIDEFIDEQLVAGRPLERLRMQTAPVTGQYAYAGVMAAADAPTTDTMHCVECAEVVATPQHCGQSMAVELVGGRTMLVCWMGPQCGQREVPEHHGRPMVVQAA